MGIAALVVTAGHGGASADDSGSGRRHAQRASHLAAGGKCKQAVAEYDKAIAVLRDPALYFNRGECHRKLGDVDAALADYHQFLIDLPAAPNRAEVQARIADLEKMKPSTRPPVGVVPPDIAPASRLAPVVRAPILDAPVTTEPAKRAGVAPHLNAPVPVAPSPVDRERPSDSLVVVGERSPPGVPGPAPGGGDASLVNRPWFWVAVFAVAAGAGIAAFAVLGRDGTTVPSSQLGNYKF